MRIISGTARGRKLLDPPSSLGIRPTSDKVRESLFNILGEKTVAARFLDIFAGTGAVGIEALSRGAREAVFVENHPRARKLIWENLSLTGLTEAATIMPLHYEPALVKLQRKGAFDIVFIDPPYGTEFALHTLRLLAFYASIATDGEVVVETATRDELPETVKNFTRSSIRRYGDTTLHFYRQM
jgi:16S rRNA (guanine966-N2)-methyltransferase